MSMIAQIKYRLGEVYGREGFMYDGIRIISVERNINSKYMEEYGANGELVIFGKEILHSFTVFSKEQHRLYLGSNLSLGFSKGYTNARDFHRWVRNDCPLNHTLTLKDGTFTLTISKDKE